MTNFNRNDVEIIEQQNCFDGFFKINRYTLRHRLFKGGYSPTITRELFERGHAAAILPYDPLADRVVLIKQFRIGALACDTGPWLLEIVAGIIEEDENAEAVAKRESIEEAGCTIQAIIPISHYLVSPGGTSEMISLFCGKVDSQNIGGVHGLSDENEDIMVMTVPTDEAINMIQTGQINSASPIIALQWLELNKDQLRQQWA